jgi:hypothetical protein
MASHQQAVMSGPHQFVDFDTKDANLLIAQMAQTLAPVYNVATPMINDCLYGGRF